jgi:hypothetical protein
MDERNSALCEDFNGCPSVQMELTRTGRDLRV